MQMSSAHGIVSELGKAAMKKLPERERERERDSARPAFECLSVSCRGMDQQCTATGTRAMGAADISVA